MTGPETNKTGLGTDVALPHKSLSKRQGLSQPSTLANIPPELQHLIVKHLNYPDRLSLREAYPVDFGDIDTGKGVKVEWILERLGYQLHFPIDSSCNLRSDAQFNSPNVLQVMQNWRRHDECNTSRCVVGSLVCLHREPPKLFGFLSIEVAMGMMVLLFAVTVAVALFEQAGSKYALTG
ncbi:MAG: hypothetical protein M1814_001756 [Vezdaea aestivalis]|nr:MAG: hypothetical protein M1814_001756 [Vezdaea aestivalis]